MGILLAKFKETVLSVLPVVLLVSYLHFTLVPLPTESYYRFLIGSGFIMLGLSIFLFGVDLAISPVGNAIGSQIARKKSLVIIISAGLILGFFINIAEPDLFVLAVQIEEATNSLLNVATILVVVSFGIGIMVAIGLLRIVFQIPLRVMLFIIYGLILILAFLAPNDLLGIAFDSGGATTGSMTVPFILALGLGVASVHGGKKGEEDAFGLIAVASGGPMLAVLIMTLIKGIKGLSGSGGSEAVFENGLFLPFLHQSVHISFEVALALLPLVVLTFLAQFFMLKLSKKPFHRILKGFLYTYVGFVFFLTGVTAGFMEAGQKLGSAVANYPVWVVLIIGFLIGLLVILAEPSVHILTIQIEDITGGSISKNKIMAALAIGVSLAIVLSLLRFYIAPLELWHLLLVLYFFALFLTLFCPPLFTGIAFDSGGVASGPMTATFVLAFVQGLALSEGGTLLDAFGTIAMVALTPLITLQFFGLIYTYKLRKKKEGETL